MGTQIAVASNDYSDGCRLVYLELSDNAYVSRRSSRLEVVEVVISSLLTKVFQTLSSFTALVYDYDKYFLYTSHHQSTKHFNEWLWTMINYLIERP